MTHLSLPCRIFGWLFMPATMRDIRRLEAECARLEEIASLYEIAALPEYTGERKWKAA